MNDPELQRRAAVHAALGEPARLALVDALMFSDRSPKELADMVGLGSNLLAHHIDVLERVGLVERSASAGDGRRKYVRLVRHMAPEVVAERRARPEEMLFLCTRNSARSQLAAGLWTVRTGGRASSAGTRRAPHVHPGAVAAARRAGFSLDDVVPRDIVGVPATAQVQVVTVCDLVHEELEPRPKWWHWSTPDPVTVGDAAAFQAVVEQLDERIAFVARAWTKQGGGSA